MTTNVDVSLPESASWDVDVTAQYGDTKTITRMRPGQSQTFYCHSGYTIHVREIQHESDEYKAGLEADELNSPVVNLEGSNEKSEDYPDSITEKEVYEAAKDECYGEPTEPDSAAEEE